MDDVFGHDGDAPYLRFDQRGGRALLTDAPGAQYQWNLLPRLAPIVFPVALVGIILTIIVAYYDLSILFTVQFFVTGVGLYIVRFLKLHTLAFLFLAIQLVALGTFAYYTVVLLPDVYMCDSPYCRHGNKILFTWIWIILASFAGFSGIVCRALLAILTTYEHVY